MVTCKDIRLIINFIKDKMDEAREKQMEALRERRPFSHVEAGIQEGKIIGLYNACIIIRDTLKEYCPELEKETCEEEES
ncbi:MAG TPA: hypothetical protein ENG13_04935 [bacterium]|nr:hypothetical protein [bacterium]HEX68391.1 hypothetical protein [bacterium]